MSGWRFTLESRPRSLALFTARARCIVPLQKISRTANHVKITSVPGTDKKGASAGQVDPEFGASNPSTRCPLRQGILIGFLVNHNTPAPLCFLSVLLLMGLALHKTWTKDWLFAMVAHSKGLSL